MFELNTLRAKLQPHLGWHGAHLLFVAAFIIALFRVRTVNLSRLSSAFPGRAKPASAYKRQQRFFRDFELDYSVVAKLVIDWMKIPEPWVLAVDRTQWDVGSTTVNILTLGVVVTPKFRTAARESKLKSRRGKGNGKPEKKLQQ